MNKSEYQMNLATAHALRHRVLHHVSEPSKRRKRRCARPEAVLMGVHLRHDPLEARQDDSL
eukprot:5905083-Amphidinium_carterae.1